MSDMTKEVNLIATFRAQAGHAETVRALIVEYGDFVRQEPGNVFFEIYTDSGDPHDFVIVERYRDQAGFDAHLATPEGAAFNQALGPLIEGSGSELQFLSRQS
jgi:quinol monooxygenase YgiN